MSAAQTSGQVGVQLRCVYALNMTVKWLRNLSFA